MDKAERTWEKARRERRQFARVKRKALDRAHAQAIEEALLALDRDSN